MKKYQARPKDDGGDEGVDDWLLTYGDLMTQLVCFFILLMSFSIVSSMKYREAAVSLHEALSGTGVLPAWESTMEDIPRDVEQWSEDQIPHLFDLKSEFDKHIKENKMSAYVETEMRDEGLVVILMQREPPIFFDSADVHIKEEAYPILRQIGELVKNIPNGIRVGGHTDSRPINTPQFPSNWELSAMRAINVLKHLSATAGIAPERLSAAGHGPYRPIASNSTELGMSKNRRVEIVILRVDNN